MVDSKGDFHLIDFGFTKPASKNEQVLQAQRIHNRSHALKEFDFFNLETQAFHAVENPTHPSSLEIAQRYITAGHERGNHQASEHYKDIFIKELRKFQTTAA